MELQVVPVPLFNRDMAVEAYLFRYQRGNNLFSINQLTSAFDGGSNSPLLEVLNLVGVDAFTLGKPIFVPIKNVMLFGDLQAQCAEPPENIVFLFEEHPMADDETFLNAIRAHRKLGYRFAFSSPAHLQACQAALPYISFVLIGQKLLEAASRHFIRGLSRDTPGLRFIATQIETTEEFAALANVGYSLYEGSFYRAPLTRGENTVAPLKMNSIRLINMVQDENFEFGEISKIVQRDTALTISLLKLVNSGAIAVRNKIKTIAHAVAMLGQREVRKWVTTAVTQSLSADKPNEVTKLSLIRARFAENLGPLFEMAQAGETLFLMGLFSVLDVILEMPMADALTNVLVSDDIQTALVDREGPLYPVLNLVIDYENADWSSVSRHMIMHNIKEEALYDAYVGALVWYKNMMLDMQQE